MNMKRHIALYFVASPLQYLAARRIAERCEAGARQVLVWYKRGVAPIVCKEHWDASTYMAWPRWVRSCCRQGSPSHESSLPFRPLKPMVSPS